MGLLEGDRARREGDCFDKCMVILHSKRQSLSPGTPTVNAQGNKIQTRRNDLLNLTLRWQSLGLLPPHPCECPKLFAEAQICCQFFFRRKYSFSKIFQNRSLSIWRQWFVLGYSIYMHYFLTYADPFWPAEIISSVHLWHLHTLL